ncbi:long-chain-fatty-acid--CoA ligase [Hoyosella subflava]|uniref:Putative acyl-CoA synthetase, long-chain fatty acid:CoA ligase n=1 Tax=Hoyosella subflava (strain DSM 45089 / JCM 17490 / NBRC 109087 / DQS3-9A1) TaxID=443218 RepID=F6EMQ8_HOYSD|nr:long-chain fatty acid--CoA ligase [Hoyosella subflava]AEF41616.1 Putative acyl-CoA synthetase, long-chain fatty acid:CoA ligase [Hoyosella subflava DQS3-9A1]
MTNVATGFVSTANATPTATAVQSDDQKQTYSELHTAARRVASLLIQRGIKPGDTVAIMLPNVAAFPALYYGILLAGGVAVPMNPLLKNREVAYYLGDSGAKLVFVWHSVAQEAVAGALEAHSSVVEVDESFLGSISALPLAGVIDRADDDTAVILYTSGTTGHPKGAELTHFNLRNNADRFAQDWLKLTADDVVLGCLPLFHTFGQTVSMNCTLFSGATLVLLTRFTGDLALEAIEKEKVTIFAGVPTMYSAMIEAPGSDTADASTLRLCCSGGAALPLDTLTSFEDKFHAVIIEGYGLSETSPVCCFNPPEGRRKIGSVGLPLEGVEMRVITDDGETLPPGELGEICVRGENVMKGYLGRPSATAEAFIDGWFRTGDIGKTDDDGYFYIVDRKKSLIIRGGYNVYPREVEEVLYEHPDIVEAAVIGIPHPTLGEEVGAAITVRQGTTLDPADISAYVKARLAAYKYPRQVWAVDELPKGPTGKILRREVQPPVNAR